MSLSNSASRWSNYSNKLETARQEQETQYIRDNDKGSFPMNTPIQYTPPPKPAPSFTDKLGNEFKYLRDKLNNLRNTGVGQYLQDAAFSQNLPTSMIQGISKAVRPILPKVSDTLDATRDAYTNSATLGAYRMLMPENTEEQRKRLEHPVANTIGNLAGYIQPGVAIEKAGVKLLPTLFKGLNPLTKTVLGATTSGAVMGGVEGATEGIGSGMGAKETLNNMGNKAYDFALAGGAGSAVLGGAANAIASKLQFNKAMKSLPQAIESYKPTPLTIPEFSVIPPKNLPRVSAEIPLKYQPNPTNAIPRQLLLPEPSPYSMAKGRIEYVGNPSRNVRPIEPNINAQKQPLNALKNEPSINSPLQNVEPIKTQNTTNNININDNLTTNNNNLNDINVGNMKQRKFISNSYMNSDVTTPEMKAKMKNKIPTYEEITNKDTLEKANEIIGKDIEKHANEFLAKPELIDAVDTAKGISLIQKSIASGNTALANDISINLAEKLTNAGQTVQAASIMKRMTPEGMLQYANKQINAYNQANPSKKVKLTPEESNFIVKNMQDIKKANNGELKLLNVDLQLFADTKLAEIFKLIGNKVPADIGQKIRAFQRINLLLNPKTMIRNLAGNVISGTVGNISDAFRAGIDSGIGKITGKRTALFPNLKEQFKGAGKGLKRVKSDWINDVNTSPTGTQYELGQGANAASPFKSKPMKFLDKITTSGLRLADDPFYQGFYDDALQQQMKLNNVDAPTADMIKHADQVARERTFQDTNYMTKLFSSLQRGLNKIGTENFGLGNIVLPFVKTPANILARALEYSPVEVTKGITKALIDAGKGNAFNQYKFVDSLAKGLTGTALIGAGYKLAEKGMITGQSTKDVDTRKYMEANGILPYSFKIGDGSYTYDWMQPSSIPLAVGADIYYNLKDKKDSGNVLLSAGESGLQTLMGQSLLQGITKMFGGGSAYGQTIGESLTNTMLSSGSQFVPFGSLLRQIAETKDPYKRNVYEDSQINSYLINPIKNTIPGLRETLPVKINSFGNPVEATGLFDTFINPARSGIGSKINPVVNDELMRLSKQSGENKQFPSLASPNISYKLTQKGQTQKTKLSPEELAQYQQKLGTKNIETIQKTMKTNEYINANDKQKATLISKAMSDNKQKAETEYLKSIGIKEYKPISSSRGGR